MKKIKKYTLFLIVVLSVISIKKVEAAEDPNKCYSNFSNIACTSSTGRQPEKVYQYCTFYGNFWNTNGNLRLCSATIRLKKNGTVVATKTCSSSDSSHYFTWCNMDFYLTEAGDYTVERSAKTLGGDTLTWDNDTLRVYDVTQCGTSLTVSPASLSLNMTGTKSQTVTVKVGGIIPDKSAVSYGVSNNNVTCSWGEWYDEDGDGNKEAIKLTVTGKTGGTATVTVSCKESTSGKVVASKNFNVTIIGPQPLPSAQTIKASGKTVAYKSKAFNLRAKSSAGGRLTYSSSNKKVATVSSAGTISVKGYGQTIITIKAGATSAYKAAVKKVTIKVVPKKMVVTKLSSSGKKKMACSWKKDKSVTGYQIHFSLYKNFKRETYERVFKGKTSKMAVVGLKSKKTYYIRIRSYKQIGKQKYFGPWSSVKKVRIK